MTGRATNLLRIYTRAFVAQSVGIIGLLWCLSAAMPWAALGLTVLVLADQLLFLKGRLAGPVPRSALETVLDVWCVVVSVADLTILAATILRALGLQDGSGHLVSDPLTCLAFAIGSFAHLDVGVRGASGGARLVAAVEALVSYGILVGALAGAAFRRPWNGSQRSR